MSGKAYIELMQYEILDQWVEEDGHVVYCVRIGRGYNDIHDFGNYFYIK